MGELLRMPDRRRKTPRTLSAITAEADDAHETADYWLTATFLALASAKDAYRRACEASRQNHHLEKRFWKLAKGDRTARFWPAFTQKGVERSRPVLVALRRWRGDPGFGPADEVVAAMRSALGNIDD